MDETGPGDGFELVPLEDMVRMKPTSFRDKDRMHSRGLASVGLVDEEWVSRFFGVDGRAFAGDSG